MVETLTVDTTRNNFGGKYRLFRRDVKPNPIHQLDFQVTRPSTVLSRDQLAQFRQLVAQIFAERKVVQGDRDEQRKEHGIVEEIHSGGHHTEHNASHPSEDCRCLAPWQAIQRQIGIQEQFIHITTKMDIFAT